MSAGAALAGNGDIEFAWRAAGAAGSLRIPEPVTPGPADGLWRHTCCEAFVAAVDAAGYREFNLSPSGQWATYRFTGYRERDTGWQPEAAPRIALRRRPDGFELVATISAALLPAGDAFAVALTAVTEDAAGDLAYWASAHAGPRPDFHLRDSFTLRLARP